jgi:murein DD-endopeptidase MepM/ murein hydrolase activator NlpD
LLKKSKFKIQKSKVEHGLISADAVSCPLKSLRRRISFWFPCWLALAAFVFAAPVFSFYEILESNTVKEGGIIKIKIGAPEGAKAADLVFLDEKYPAFFKGYKVNEREMVYTAMVPVPLGTKGRKTLNIRVLLAGGIEEKEEKISVKKIMEIKSEVSTGGQMNKELLDALRNENKIIYLYVGKVTPVKYDMPFIMPVEGEISTTFGASRSYDEGEAAWRHKGLDIAAKEGTPVKASNNGTVVMSARGKAYGNSIIIDHGGGIFTLYFHMQTRFAKAGDKVAKGDVIGAVGSTGLSTGPHCHFQTDLFRVQVNPNELISSPEPVTPQAAVIQ